MRFKISTSILFLVLLMTACSPAITESTPGELESTLEPTTVPTLAPVIVTDQRGKEFSFEQPAMRIISLAPANTEILFAVGAGQQVVGRDTFSDYPADALSVPDIGGGFGALDTETLLASDPDLVLAGELTPVEQIQALDDLGLSVFVLGNPVDLPGMYENLRTVARMTGHLKETETLIVSLQARVTAVEQTLEGITDRPLVLYELDGTDPNAPWVPGAKNRS